MQYPLGFHRLADITPHVHAMLWKLSVNMDFLKVFTCHSEELSNATPGERTEMIPFRNNK